MKSFIFRLSNQLLIIKLRSAFRRLKFWFHKRRYTFTEQIENLGETALIFFSFLLNAVFPLILSFVTVWFFWFVTNKKKLPSVPIGNETSYDTLLITIVSTTGIFLSLYFSGLNTVVGGIYAKSSARIRNLFIQEKFGKLSIKLIIWLTLSSFGLLLLGVIFEFRPAWGLIFIVVFGCFVILVFIQLSRNAYRFFDPTTFCNQLETEFLHYVKLASSESPLFKEQGFQLHFHNHARKVLDSYQNLLNIVLTEDQLIDQGLTNLIKSLGIVYVKYLPCKSKIPTDSKWFEMDHIYKDWYLNESHLVSLFLLRRKELPFTETYNYDWVENEIEDIIVSIITTSRVSDRIKQVALSVLYDIFTVLGQNGYPNNYIRLHKRISKICNRLIMNEDKCVSSEFDKQLSNPQIVDILCSFQIIFLINWKKYLEVLSLSKLKNKISKINWSADDGIYSLPLPFSVINQLEDIGSRLNYEIKIERIKVTPDWFIVELISRIVYNYWIDSLQEIGKYNFEYLTKGIDTYKEKSSVLILAHYLSRGQEYVNEVLEFVKKLDNQLLEFSEKKINDFVWNEWNNKNYLDEINSFNDILLENISKNLISFGKVEFDGKNPDFFGKFLAILSEECINSLEVNDYEKFSTLFPDYFHGCLAAYEIFYSRAEQKLLPQFWHTVAFDPIIDLFYISGYALLYSEYFQETNLWEICTKRWDKYSQDDKAVERINVLAEMYKYHRSSIIMTERAKIRIRWNTTFSKIIREIPRTWVQPEGAIGSYEVPDHPSEIIKIVGRNSYRHPDDIFLDFYFGQNKIYKDIQFPLRTRLSSYLKKTNDSQDEMDVK